MPKVNSFFGRAMSAGEYAGEWDADSTAFAAEGVYAWMRAQLGSHSTVLEVGCGSGRGTELLAKGHNVVSIEPNQEMANSAMNHLISSGIDAKLTKELPTALSANVTIVISDIFELNDDWVKDNLRLDAIVCWLIGAEPARISMRLSKNLDAFTGQEMSAYRELVHRRCYSLGEYSLDESGIVHIVDRLFISSWQEKNSARRAFADMHSSFASAAYKFSFEDTRFRRYSQPLSRSNIQLAVDEDPVSRVTVFASNIARLQRREV